MELRAVRTAPPEFRRAANRISVLLAAEALRDVPSRQHTVDTPLGPADGTIVDGDVVVVPVLRAGLGMLDDLLEAAGARTLRIICIVAAPEGVALVEQHHPEVAIYTPVVDRELNPHKYIVPGLGDFGDRLYGTT